MIPTYQGSNLWTYTTAYFQINTGTGAWENGKSYVVHEVMTDKAGNTFDNVHAAFTYDIMAPTSTIQVPQNGLPGVRSLPSLSGIVADNFVSSNVQVAIYDPIGVAWFDGSGFNVVQSTPNYLNVTSLSSNATSWTYAPSSFDPKFLDHRQYLILTRALDVAGNTQTYLGLGISSETITIDRTPPVVTLTAPPNANASYQPANIGQFGGGTRFHGTVSDPG